MECFSLGDFIERYRKYLTLKIGESAADKKILKLKTVIFQILYPRMGQPNTSRKSNQALLAKIPIIVLLKPMTAVFLKILILFKPKGINQPLPTVEFGKILLLG